MRRAMRRSWLIATGTKTRRVVTGLHGSEAARIGKTEAKMKVDDERFKRWHVEFDQRPVEFESPRMSFASERNPSTMMVQ